MEVAWDRAPPPYPPPPVTDWALHGVSTQSAGLEYIPSSAYSTLPPQPVHHHIYSAPALATTLDAYANVPRMQYVDPNLSPVTPNADTPVFPVPLTSSSDLMPSTAVDWDRVKFPVCETDRQRTFNQKYDMLYPFQKEVFCRSVSKGSIIFMPTGAGKTIVAAAMAAYHHALHPSKRIVFIVNRVPLVSQQALVLNRFGLRVAQICGDKKDAASWSQAAEAFDAVVIIDALLIEYITRHSTALFDDVSLMVFDEIHHARKSSNYAKLLQLMGKSDRPHVLGLSASPSARESVDKTRKALEELMGLTRCQIVCVLNEREDLAARVSTPQTNLVEFSPNRIERCLDSVIKIAINAFEETIVPMIRKIDASMAFPLEACLGFPHGSPQYIVKAREAQTIYLQQGQASYATVANHLQALHQALILLEEWSACDAASFLLTHPTAAEVMPSSEEALHDLVAARVIDLEAQQADCTVLSALHACSAPLYVCICQMIHLLSEHRMSTKMKVLFKTLEEIVGNEEKSKLTEFRGIVFCETKAATVEITTRLAESPLGKILHPTYFVGHGRTLVPQLGGRSISMNDTQQQKALRAFREGDTKLLIATSVAEEGLDIPMCNVVIRYEGVFSVQSFIQSRGRARKSNSQFVVISKMSHSNPFADVLRDCMVQNDVVEAMSMANQDAVISATERNNEPMRVFEADPIKFLLQVRDEHQANVLLEERSCRGGVEVTITVSLSNGTVVRGVGLGNQQRAAQEARLRAVQQLYKLGYIRNDTVVSSMALSGSRELKKFRYFTNPNVALSNTRGTKTGDTSSDAQPNITGYDQEHWGSYVKPYVLLDRHLRDKGFEAPRVAMAVTDPTQPVDPINSIAVSIQFQMRAKSAGSGGDVKWFFLSDKGPTWESALQNTALLALRALGVNIVSKPHTRWDE